MTSVDQKLRDLWEAKQIGLLKRPIRAEEPVFER